MRAWFLIVILLSGCKFDGTGFVDTDADITLPDSPPADAAGCIPADYPKCQADDTTLEECVGGLVQTTACDALTCLGSAATPRCGTVMPSNGIDPSAVTGAGAITVPAGAIWTVRTFTGEIITCGGTTIRPAGDGMNSGIRFTSANGSSPSILGFQSLTVEAGAEVRFFGRNSVALVTATSLHIEGQLTVAGGVLACGSVDQVCERTQSNRRCGGAGGSLGGDSETNGDGTGGGQSVAASGSDFEFGGGGGGFGAGGGRGGPDGGNNGPAGGTSYGSVSLQPLVGGSGGAGGGQVSGNVGAGGGGGGAIQLTSFQTLVITNTGRIKATGAGGGRSSDAGAGGGGAGGAILIEAPSVIVSAGGQLSANGGGGGGGGGGVVSGNAGAGGDFGSTQASGGLGVHLGGTGGSRTSAAGGDGQQGANTVDGSGGGGGAAGRIYFRSRVGGFEITTGTDDISPQEGGQTTDLVQ